jgi:hypothetical protein
MLYAFAYPIPEGKTEQIVKLDQQVFGPRSAENAELNRRAGIREESQWIQRVGDMDVVLAVYDMDDPARLQEELDSWEWFREQIEAIFGVPYDDLPGQPEPILIGHWKSS